MAVKVPTIKKYRGIVFIALIFSRGLMINKSLIAVSGITLVHNYLHGFINIWDYLFILFHQLATTNK